MPIVNPYNAVIAKAKAKYGKRIRQKDYEALVKCRSVSEVVQYLKSYTYYRTFLGKVGKDVHRGNLEKVLRENLFESFLSLCRYHNAYSPVTEYILRSTEINELNQFITLLSIGKPQEYIFSLSVYFNKLTEIDLEMLSKVRGHSDLIEAVKGTIYEEVIRKNKPIHGEYDLSAIADQLLIAVILEFSRDISEIKNKKEKEEILSLFRTLADYQNYSRVMRMKRYYHMNNEAVKTHLLPFGTFVGKKLDQILMKESYEDVRAAFLNTSVGKKAKEIDIDSEMAIQGRYEKCRQLLYFSTNPEVVLLAYYIVCETELKNIITIIEGVRYSIDPKSIKEMLIL